MALKQKTLASETQTLALSPATKEAMNLFGGEFKRPGEISSLKNSLVQLKNAPQSQWNRIIKDGSSRFFNPKQREAARKILRSEVYEASIEFSAQRTNGRPSNIRTELRLPEWTYGEGKLSTLRSHLRDGLTVSDALKAVGIKENLVGVYRIYSNGRRVKADLGVVADKTLPALYYDYGDIRARINKPKYGTK